jgi:hypothetical protein
MFSMGCFEDGGAVHPNGKRDSAALTKHLQMTYIRSMKRTSAERPRSRDEVLNFRTDRDLVRGLDRLAAEERRTRANLIEKLLAEAIDLDAPIRVIELIVNMLNSEVERRGEDSLQAEYIRGQLHGAKWMLAELRGSRVKSRVCDEVRKRTGRPFPHIVPLAPDGKRYGFDSDADIDGA